MFPEIRDTFLGGAYNQNYSVLGPLLGFPLFMEIAIRGLRHQDLIQVQGLGWGLAFRVWGLELGASSVGFRVWGLGFQMRLGV